MKIILDILSPKKCFFCKKEGYFVCKDCFKKIPKNKEYCYICKKYSKNFSIHKNCLNNNFYLDKVIVYSKYSNKILKKIIIESKYNNKKSIFEDISDELINYIKKYINLTNYNTIGTPMHFWKKLVRGYNQTELLADLINNNKGEKNICIIRKDKITKSQAKLNKQKREINLIGSFKAINISHIKGKRILIVDDVVSTGSTLNEIAKILKKHGATEVVGFCLGSE